MRLPACAGDDMIASLAKRKRPSTRVSPAPAPAAATSWLAQPLVVASVLVGLNLFVYASVRHFQLVNWDDSTYVTENPTVLGGLSWSSAWWALTTGHSSGPKVLLTPFMR